MTREELLERSRQLRDERREILRRAVRTGDLLTCSTCGGYEERVFVRWEGDYLLARPTALTRRLQDPDPSELTSPGNVTHVNRDQIESLEWLSDDYVEEVRANLRLIRRP